ncbi:MAG: TonB-dependent receptor, partial [Blastocatellia bacterium]
DFHGSLYYVYRNDSLSGDRYSRSTGLYNEPVEFKEDTKGLTFGGPIWEDNLFFFVSYEELASTRSSPQFGPFGSTLDNTSIQPSAIAGAQAIASGTYGIDIGGVTAPAAELSVKDSLIKLDANLGERHRASLRWSKTEQAEPIFPNNFNNLLSLSSHWYSQDKSIETFVGQWFADWTDSFSTEFKASFRDYASAPINNSDLPSIRLNFTGALPVGTPASIPTSAGLIFGTERSRHFNDLATKTWNYYFGANLFVGDHEMKFGADWDDNEVYNAFLQDTRGNYTFACINGAAGFYLNPLIAAGITCNSASRAAVEAATLENFQRGRPTSYSVQVGAPGFTLDDGVAQWDYQNLGVFLQDAWTVNDKLTVNMGVRFDQKQMNTSPLFNAAAAATTVNGALTGSTNPQNGTVTRATGGFERRNDVTLDGNTLVQPRFGFNYTFDSDRPTQLRGGFGLFEGAAASVWLSNPYSNNGIATRVIGCGITGFGSCPTTGGLFSPDPNAQPTTSPPLPVGTVGAANVDFLSEDLDQPSVWKANLAFEHELPFWNGTTFAVEYIHTEVENSIYYKNLNLGLPTRTGTDGRDLYYRPTGYNGGTTASGFNTGSCWNSSGSAITSGACAVPAGQSLTRALSNAS